ncbi:uncharacterized protein LOC124327597 [Daphnia pulicaria]|uniref:uncharacterized protein LOC124327597 n=1 Tax=Daphnia pulicaria TaxID=35523 RepID=UPI001EEC8D49|nr:uncharacterized protein LOC124327597 [Daphnia pulicaria]
MPHNCSYFMQSNIDGPVSVSDHLAALGAFGTAFSVFGIVSTLMVSAIFVLSIFHVVKKSTPQWRRLLTWIVSMPMIVSILSLITFIVPGAAILCETVKQSYLPFVLMHFIDLSLLMEGGHRDTIQDLTNKDIPINFCRPPWCCIGLCYKNITYNKKNLRIMKGLVYQTPLFQLVINLIMAILESAGVLERVIRNVAFAVLGVTNIIFFTIGMYGYNVLTTGFAQLSEWKNYPLKARVLFLCVVLLKVQTLILLLLGVGGSIPCIEPYISPVVMRKSIEAALCLVEALIFAVIFFPVFRVVDNGVDRLNVPTAPTTPISAVSSENLQV